jgi:hypothetical protein
MGDPKGGRQKNLDCRLLFSQSRQGALIFSKERNNPMELQGIQASMASSSAMRVQSRTLTDEQKSKLEEILSKYDSANMTEADQKSLMEELRSANIPPCKATFETMEAAGFAKPTPPAGPPPDQVGSTTDSGSTTDTGSVNAAFLALLRQFQAGEVSESEFLDELNNIKEELEQGTGAVIDTTA